MNIFYPYQTIVILAPSSGGKTTLMCKMVQRIYDIFEPTPSLIIYVYRAYDPAFDDLLKQHKDKILFLNEMVSSEELLKITNNQQHTILFLDDQTDFCNDPQMVELFTYLAHHARITPVVATQSLSKGKFSSTLAQNTHSLIILPGPRALNNILTIGKQLGDYSNLKAIYKEVEKQGPYSNLVINLHPAIPREFTYMSNFIKGDGTNLPLIVYLPKR